MGNLKYFVAALIAASLVSCGSSGGDGSSNQTNYDQNSSVVNSGVNLSCEGQPGTRQINIDSVGSYGVPNLNKDDLVDAVEDGCFNKVSFGGYYYANKISYKNNNLDQDCEEKEGWFGIDYTQCNTSPSLYSYRQEHKDGNIVSDFGNSKEAILSNIINKINSSVKVQGVLNTSGIRIEQSDGNYIIIDRNAPIVVQPVFQKSGDQLRQVFNSPTYMQ